MAAAADVKVHMWDFYQTFSMWRADVPVLVELVRFYTQTKDDAERYQATEAYARRFIEYQEPPGSNEHHREVMQPLIRLLRLVVRMDEVKTDADAVWDVFVMQPGSYVVPYLQVHCFLLPHLPPAGVRRLERLLWERLMQEYEPEEWKYKRIKEALAPLFAQMPEERTLRSTQLLTRLEEGAAAHLPRLPRDLSHYVASFLLPPAFVQDLRRHPPVPNAAQVARQGAFVQHAEQAAAAAELERRQGVRRRMEQDHKEQEKEKQQKRE